MRVLEWIIGRVKGEAYAEESPLGWMPRYEDIEWRGIEGFDREQFYELMAIDRELWKSEILSHQELFEKLYDKLPREFILMRELLLSALWRSPAEWGLAHEHY
jgi:phosphoenolpyruvate carboxykinase (GTP)